jgi:hypothetical protein
MNNYNFNANQFNIYSVFNEIYNGLTNANIHNLHHNLIDCMNRVNNLRINDLNHINQDLNNRIAYQHSLNRLNYLNSLFINNQDYVLAPNDMDDMIERINELHHLINRSIDRMQEIQNNNINNNA